MSSDNPLQPMSVCKSVLTHHTLNILSRASEVGSPTNPPWAPGSDKTRGQGSFDFFSHNYLQKFKKETDCTFDPLFTKTG